MPGNKQKETIAECANLDCEVQIYPGQEHWKKGHLKYCCGKCFAEASGSAVITADVN